MDQLIELLKQIQELAGAAIDALEGAAGGGGEQPPAEGGGAPAEGGGAPAGPAEEMPPGK